MSDLGEHIGLHSDELRTFCTALTGDVEEAEALASRAAGGADSRAVRRGDVGADVAIWRAAVHEYVSSRSDRKQARVRAVRVLRELEDLEPRDIAPLVGRRTRWVARQLARTPLHGPDGLEAAAPRRTGRAIAFGTAVVLLVALGAAGVLKARDDGKPTWESGAAPTDPGLLPWPARGELGRDRAFHSAAAAVWRASDHQVAQTYVLWAGRLSGGRLALLQGEADGKPTVALVADGDRGLHLIQVAATQGVPRALSFEYAGPAAPPPTADGLRARTVRVLVAPDVSRVERRGAMLGTSPDLLNYPAPWVALRDWAPLDLDDGMTEAWLDLSGPTPLTALRLDGRTDRALLLGASPELVLPEADLKPWSGEPIAESTTRSAERRVSEALALAQVLRLRAVEVRRIEGSEVDGSDDAGTVFYAARVPESPCPECSAIFSVSIDAYSGGGPELRISAVEGLVSVAGTVLTRDRYSYRIFGPTVAARCVFGRLRPPPPLNRAEPATAMVEPAEYDGSYVCVDARGAEVDRSPVGGGFATPMGD